MSEDYIYTLNPAIGRTLKKSNVKKKSGIFMTEYVQRNMKDMRTAPFSDVDSLILSQLCYMHLEAAVPGINTMCKGIYIKDLYKAELFSPILDGIRAEPFNRKLLYAVRASPRFRDIMVNYFSRNTDTIREEQFCAVSFFLPTGEVYIAFRGTDASVVGWKEDFNMAFRETVPSQRSAVEYLKKVANTNRKAIYLGGHSKGGNLALYAAVFAPKNIQKRIKAIFNHDGPGLSPDFAATDACKSMQSKLRTTLPVSSLFGMVYNSGDYKVVTSSKNGVLAHDPFTWMIDGDDFLYAEKVSSVSEKIPEIINEITGKLDETQRKALVDTIFDVIKATGSTTFSQWPSAAVKELDNMIYALKTVDPQTGENAKTATAEIVKTTIKNIISLPDISSILPAKFKHGIQK